MLIDPTTDIAGRSPGLAEEHFEHDGLITKRILRAAAMAHLRPLPGQLMWDVGAGAGSVAIEWCRSDPSLRAIAIERRPERAARALDNAKRLTVPGQFTLLDEDAESALARMAAAGGTVDAVFVGGGGSGSVMEHCWSALRPAGRIVLHGVTVETERLAISCQQRWGGTVSRVGVETMDRIGRLHGWQPARVVVQWAAIKVGADAGVE